MKAAIVLLFCVCLGTGTAFAEGKRLAVDKSQSHVDVVVKATVDSFTGHLENYDAQIAVDPTDPRLSTASLRFRFVDLKTGKPARDEEMHHWQETEKFPDASFVLTSLAPDAARGFTAQGNVALHGTTHPVSFPVTISGENGTWLVDGQAELDTREFGLPVIRKFALLKVSPLVRVQFHLQGTLIE